MLQIFRSLSYYITNDRWWNQCETDRDHKYYEDSIYLSSTSFKFFSNWERRCCHFEFEVWISCRLFQDWLVHKLRIECGNILWGNIQESGNLELFGFIISFIDKVWAISVRFKISIESLIEYILVKLSKHILFSIRSLNSRIIFICYFKGTFVIRRKRFY